MLLRNQQVRLKGRCRFGKHLSLKKARELSEKFCEDFRIPYCGIYYVDHIEGFDDEEEVMGIYTDQKPSHILVVKSGINRLGLVMHELTHHLEQCSYDNKGESEHGYSYQKAKERVVTWCRKNISDKPNWYNCLKATFNKYEMKAFQL